MRQQLKYKQPKNRTNFNFTGQRGQDHFPHFPFLLNGLGAQYAIASY
jgi:hypothetical protein